MTVWAPRPGKYEQTGGTATIAGDLKSEGTSTSDYSYVYLGTNAGLLDVNGEVINHSGYYDQDGGVMTTSHFTNDSTSGVNVDNNAEFRATALTHNAGNFTLWRNAIVRGELAYPPSTYWLCNFANNATFQMGSAAFNGGSFRGILTNNGTFNYYQGDFSGSSLLNYGTFNNYANFTCRRFVNYANFTLNSDRWITADGLGYANAVENNGTLTMYPSSHIDVGNSSKLVNNGPMYAGGPGATYAHVYGDMENHNYLLPCHSALPSGHLYVNGDFTAYRGPSCASASTARRSMISIACPCRARRTWRVSWTSGSPAASYRTSAPASTSWGTVPASASSTRSTCRPCRPAGSGACSTPRTVCDLRWLSRQRYSLATSTATATSALVTSTLCALPVEPQHVAADVPIARRRMRHQRRRNYPSFGDINPFVTLLSSGG
jgi:hypothetical protein